MKPCAWPLLFVLAATLSAHPMGNFSVSHYARIEVSGGGAEIRYVLDLGSCFGFLPLLLAERPANTVTASDLSGGTMGLLSAVAAARGLQVNTLVCDAARIPVPDGWADTVSVIHLLEHVSPDHGRAVIGRG